MDKIVNNSIMLFFQYFSFRKDAHPIKGIEFPSRYFIIHTCFHITLAFEMEIHSQYVVYAHFF